MRDSPASLGTGQGPLHGNRPPRAAEPSGMTPIRTTPRGFLHPSRLIAHAGGGAVAGRIRRFVVRRLYEHLARAYPLQEWTTMNYGYASLPREKPVASPDAPERNGLLLYARVAASGRRGADLDGLDVLEVGSGRGGGAAFLAQAFRPARYLGLDVAAASAALAAARYAAAANLAFMQGDAEALPLDDAAFDIVLNIESAHCYASVPRFLSEAARVLRPGGELLFAGFVAAGAAQDRLLAALANGKLTLGRVEDITPNVVLALRQDEARKRDLIQRAVGPLLRSFATGAYAMEGTAARAAFEAGRTRYLIAALTKP